MLPMCLTIAALETNKRRAMALLESPLAITGMPSRSREVRWLSRSRCGLISWAVVAQVNSHIAYPATEWRHLRSLADSRPGGLVARSSRGGGTACGCGTRLCGHPPTYLVMFPCTIYAVQQASWVLTPPISGGHCHVVERGKLGECGVTSPMPSYKGHRYPVEIINHCVWLYFRFPLSFREVEEMMLERGVVVSYETIRRWCAKFGQAYANELRRRRSRKSPRPTPLPESELPGSVP